MRSSKRQRSDGHPNFCLPPNWIEDSKRVGGDIAHNAVNFFTFDLSARLSNSSAIVFFSTGCTRRGATSTSGSRTKRRSCKRGWGSLRNSVSLNTSHRAAGQDRLCAFRREPLACGPGNIQFATAAPSPAPAAAKDFLFLLPCLERKAALFR